jgi:DNA primase
MVINDVTFDVDCYSVISELKQQLQINKINLLGVVQDTSDNVMVSCPYHKDGQERRPSMGIKKSDGTCHCFACGTVVGLPEMISHCFGHDSLTGAFGWEWLLKNFLTVSVEERQPIELNLERHKHTTQKEVEYVSEEELDSYRYYHPYWGTRKITDKRLIELFDLGFDPKTNCITMPVRDVQGHTLFVARRSVNTKYFNYPRGVEKPLYGLYELWQQAVVCTEYVDGKLKQNYYSRMFFPKEVIVCESMIDALTAWQYGKYAVALNGLGTALQFKQLRDLPCRKIILATDADEAGMQARERIMKNVSNKLITQYVWDVHVAKDLNDMDKEMFDNLKEIL